MSSKRFFNKSIATALSLATILTTASPCTSAVNVSNVKNAVSNMSTAKKIAIGAGVAIVTTSVIIVKHLCGRPQDPNNQNQQNNSELNDLQNVTTDRNTNEVIVEKLKKDSQKRKQYDLLLEQVKSDENVDSVGEILNKNKNISVNARFGEKNTTLLHIAAKHNATAICKLLIACGANVDTIDNHKWTPLHIAASFGSVECCQVLLDNKADPHSKDDHNREPLYWAKKQNKKYLKDNTKSQQYKDIIKLLNDAIEKIKDNN